jgi:ketol-acid reductoisomerase
MLVDFSLGLEADFPFTTMRPDVGMADLGTRCVHEEMGVVDKPKNSVCANGARHPAKLIVDLVQKYGIGGMCRRVIETTRYGGRTRGKRAIGPDEIIP